MPRNRKLDIDEAPAIGGGQKSPSDRRDPLVGEKRTTKAPVERTKRQASEVSSRTELETHGAPAVVDQAVERGVEADEAAPRDQAESAEAVDQSNVIRPVDVERAELDAGSHAERLARVEDERGTDATAFGVMAAGDRQGDHVRNVEKAAIAADEAPDNVARARAFESLDDLDQVDSPHGRTAEEHDPWVASRWAPHGDQNVPAISYGPEDVAVYGDTNPQARDQARGLEGDTVESVKEAKAEAGPGDSIARERLLENQAARRIAREES